jgi:hypothetical protein
MSDKQVEIRCPLCGTSLSFHTGPPALSRDDVQLALGVLMFLLAACFVLNTLNTRGR